MFTFVLYIAEKSVKCKQGEKEKEEEGIKSFREELDEIGMVSLVAGVPVVAFPQWDDQMTNAQLLTECWKTGVRVMEKKEGEEVVVESGEIRRCIEEVMEKKAEEFRRNAARWKDIAAETVGEGGSLFNHLKAFVDEHM
ncbi:hypothetical protein F2Q68_00040159 [Brassica cretica]|uniref:Uncharacterized protein n=1 Tax=Brassica cretica TaxID=69181 RepID=A0A8S9MHV1_BRACR|nr:hypothetical protein F2Q68_00040159 [Brassica cretica]